ncbi:MAG: hypothetical protein MJZ72_04055 [Bacteroidales bacterium]|nr:hypothetical protein [Bacteroidales bacterium]
MENKKELLSQIIDNLTIIKNSKTEFSPIEKDIVLQNLRDAYLLILNDFSQDLEPQENVSEEDGDVETIDNQENILQEETTAQFQNEAIVEEEPVEEIVAPEEIKPELNLIEEIKPQETPIVEEISKEVFDNQDDVVEEPSLEEKTQILEDIVLGKTQAEKSEAKLEEVEEVSSIDDEMDEDILQFVKPSAEVMSEPVAETTPEPEPDLEPVIETKSEPAQGKQVEQTLFPLEPETPKTKPQRSLNDLFNEQKQDNSLGTKFQQAKVTDLTKALSINDKFLFIRELFKNKSEEFSRAIQLLNNCSNIEEAFDVMEGLKKQYFWDSTSSAYLALCDLVRKKF